MQDFNKCTYSDSFFLKNLHVAFNQTCVKWLVPAIQMRPMKTVQGIAYVCTERNFAPIQQNFFEKTSKEVCSPDLYASFGTFCAEIGQIFASQ